MIKILCALPPTVVSSIRVLVRSTPSLPFPSDSRLTLVPGSLAVGAPLPPLSGVSVLFHLASGKDYAGCLDVDCGSVGRLASAAKAAGVRRFVLVSSQLVHPANKKQLIRGFLNTIVTGLWARYGLMDMKFVGEEFLRRACTPAGPSSDTPKLTYTIVRPGRLLDAPPTSPDQSSGDYSFAHVLLAQNNARLAGDLRGVYRRDVAALCALAALAGEEAANVTFEMGANKVATKDGEEGPCVDNTGKGIAKWVVEGHVEVFQGLSKEFDKGWGEDMKEFKDECTQANADSFPHSK